LAILSPNVLEVVKGFVIDNISTIWFHLGEYEKSIAYQLQLITRRRGEYKGYRIYQAGRLLFSSSLSRKSLKKNRRINGNASVTNQ